MDDGDFWVVGVGGELSLFERCVKVVERPGVRGPLSSHVGSAKYLGWTCDKAFSLWPYFLLGDKRGKAPGIFLFLVICSEALTPSTRTLPWWCTTAALILDVCS